MNAITQLDDALIEQALSHYDVGGLQRYWAAANGIENSNYFVETSDAGRVRRFVLTIHEQQANAGDAYVAMMDALEQAGFPVAPPLRNVCGQPVDDVAGKPATLQWCLPGKHVQNPTTRQVCALARFAARMHLATAETQLELPDYPRDAHWLGNAVQRVLPTISLIDAQLLSHCCNGVNAMLSRQDAQSLPRGMIHGDLFRDNVLFNERGLSGVLDFHHASCGYWVYDLAVIANDWCTDASGMLDPDRTIAMLRAYSEIRPLWAEELWFFSSFTLYAALAFWLSRLVVRTPEDGQAPARLKNPDEFKAITQQHLAHPFFVDSRIILG